MVVRRLGVILLGLGAASAGAGGCGSSAAGGGTGGAPTTASSTHASSTAGPVTGTGGSDSGNLARSCTTDADCGGSLGCVLPTANDPVFGGGPVGGYCTMSCKTDGDCPGPTSVCVTGTNGAGLCELGCTLGPQLGHLDDPLDPDKCWGRDDLRCAFIASTLTACVPTCGKDSQCPSGRVCDPRLTVCVDTPTSGLGAGSVCVPKATPPQCAGVCVSFTGGATACSEPCVLGGQDLLTSPSCGGVTAGLCVYSPAGNGAGDYGFCAPACTKQDDCQTPAFWCLAVGGLTGKGTDNGFCLGGTGCPNGDADCAQHAGTTCTATKDGPFCLPAAFPLGGETPDAGADGGTGGAGGATSSAAGTGGASSSAAGTGGATSTSATGTGGATSSSATGAASSSATGAGAGGATSTSGSAGATSSSGATGTGGSLVTDGGTDGG